MSTDPPAANPTPSPAMRRRRDRAVKLAFLAAVVAVAAAVWWTQREGADWSGWQQDLPAAASSTARG